MKISLPLDRWILLLKQRSKLLLWGSIPIILLMALLIWKGRNSDNDTSEIIKGSIIESVYGLATVSSSEVYHLRVAIPSAIRKIYVEEGDQVQEGTPLVEFDSFGTMKSPFSGVVTNVAYETKETVVPQTPVVTVMDLKKRYLTVSLEEKGAVKVKKGQKVRIRFEALGDKNFEGEVKSVYPADGQFQVNITPIGIPPEILPGMTADVAIETSSKENVILVPIKGIKSGKVKVLENGNVHIREVETGITNGEYAELVSGEVSLGDKVLVQEDK
ncbi:efflux RND transporter periplasmic adaptor subunit [Leptospira licerasiae]|uniref:HlyD family secretion protein n=1 Tax=Leptospira licerasiae str. MMD4847 TaxID=1049971 RepID=A0ABP2RDR7_9LEPT|nr:efflux RND transporter periplasmic adaptor subunit [Leptospira licerasiae]EID99688.1 HlyD family secretion domain protein [Leptospira licerasiae serovar Varillal str. VAR 010]EJZ41492.1 HlyD family secretion protein [Leptospira licerasiae str. MMD4847]TGM91033.1 HlyD family efflux transporter periplasmic adaptor subunit [Leptospira licerasiae]